MFELYFAPWNDGHAHCRDPEILCGQIPFELVMGTIAKQCDYAVFMPNTPVIQTIADLYAYRDLIQNAIRNVAPRSDMLQPLMTMYLTEDVDIETIKRAASMPFFAGWKFYPKGVTTGSGLGIKLSEIQNLKHVLNMIELTGSRLLIHGEDPDVDPLFAEEAFVVNTLPIIRKMFSGKICLEHCSTKAAVDAVLLDNYMWGSVTPHHMTGIFDETNNPHNRCKPVWQTEENRRAVVSAVINDTEGKFFAGTDTAPHLLSKKSSDSVPNGCFSSPVTIPLYLKAFSEAVPSFLPEVGRDSTTTRMLENFLYKNMAIFYGQPCYGKNVSTDPFDRAVIVVTDQPSQVAHETDYCFYNESTKSCDAIVPLRAGEMMGFSVKYL